MEREIVSDTVQWIAGIHGEYWWARLECGHGKVLPTNWGRTVNCVACESGTPVTPPIRLSFPCMR